MLTKKFHFVVVDDSKLDCFIAEKIIRNTEKCESIKSFQLANEALEYMRTTRANSKTKTKLLVDIRMPVMNGFEFVEAFQNLPLEITSNCEIYLVLSSELSSHEQFQPFAARFPVIKQILSKPLTSNNLSLLFKD